MFAVVSDTLMLLPVLSAGVTALAEACPLQSRSDFAVSWSTRWQRTMHVMLIIMNGILLPITS